MQRKIMVTVAAVATGLLLAACGRANLTTTKTTYHQDGLVAAVKGHSSAKEVTYQVDHHSKKTVTVRNGTFVIQVPSTTHRQAVKLQADGLKTTTHVAAAKSLGSYQSIQKKFNQSLVGATMSKADQRKAQAVAKAAVAIKQQPTPALAETLSQQGPAVKKAMGEAQQKVHGQLLPTKTPGNGVQNVVTTKGYKIRMNIQDGNVLGATMIVSTKSFKQAAGQRAFGTSFVILANSTGADGQSVLKQFGDETKKLKKGANTIDPIHSHGVNFTVGLSTGDFFIFMDK
ncbi:hypothetical protein [Furfurilactobacillus siliginis]|uniref:Lipoprotein n=2 Tax=Furfurilactobacillus siliginis TaxID=348151 RepID=A0A510VRP3_9LACO|nr:hypothetical protein [Furfurilactobacillus siliginis]GEK29633.1 lipoprotein [Furfurilactobacillus siliginis]